MYFHAREDLNVEDIAIDSRLVHPGSLFVAISGETEDGHDFINAAAARGAVCVVCEKPPEIDIAYVLVSDTHAALGLLAARFYGEPAEKLTLIGVTGTNGKTTTTYLLKQLLEKTEGAKVGLIGTNRNMIGQEILDTERTTPDALSLQRLFSQMVKAGCRYAVMEVSSHALMQKRTAGLHFAVGIFTNLTQDHLDYHGTMEAYCDAKAKLFSSCDAAVVNGDDPWTPRLLEGFTGKVVTFGQGLTNDVVAYRPRYENDRVRFAACSDTDHVETYLMIPGAFSLYNALGALAAMQTLGVSLPSCAKALKTCTGVCGRCEVVPVPADYTVIIDYAHTPDGLKNILTAVCGFAEERVIAVFGCGGDRDRTKRARMGKISAALADFVVLTSDNPRTEDPYAILREVYSGMENAETPFAIIEDRREAIRFALRSARRGDVVVLCGKGHETYQVIGTTKYPLDEREVVRAYFEKEQRKDTE